MEGGQHGCSQSYFDMGGGWYDDPGLMSTVHRQLEVAKEALTRDRSSAAEVAVVIDPEAFARHGVLTTVNSWQILGQMAELGYMGAPFDLMSLADIDRLPPQKLWLFLNLYDPTNEEIVRIHARLKKDRATGVFVYAAGHLAGKDGAARLTGMAVLTDGARRKVDVRVSAGKLGLIQDAVYGTSSKVGPSRFEGGEISPTFSVRDAGAEVLGLDTRSGQPGMCRKDMGGWTSVYSSAPGIAACVLRGLAKAAGVHIYLEEDAAVYANSSLVSVTVVQPGKRRISLPREGNVIDAITGKRVADRAASFEWEFHERESRLFLLQR